MLEAYYRVEDQLVNVLDSFEDSHHVEVRVYGYSLPVLKHTPKGVWLETPSGSWRFVLNGAHKRFACPTWEAAKESFTARKNKQIKIYQNRVANAKRALAMLDRLEQPE